MPEALEDLVDRIAAERGRGPGTDAERRVAVALRDIVDASGRATRIDTIWVRPDWALSAALHLVAALAGGVVGIWVPAAGLAVLAFVGVSLVGDLRGGWHWLRRLTFNRATQNVVSSPSASEGPERIRLVVCAALDAPRDGAFGPVAGALLTPALLGVVALAVVLVARLAGASGQAVGAVQLVVMVALLAIGAVLLDTAWSETAPGGAEAAALAVALALVARLDATPLQRLEVELVLAGAGTGPALGMDAHMRRLARSRCAEDTVVLAIEPCGSCATCWLVDDGRPLRLRHHPRLVSLAEGAARAEAHLGARGVHGRGCAQSFPARRRRWPAIAVGARPARRVSGASGATAEPRAMRDTLELAVALALAVDRDLALRDVRAREHASA